MPLDNERIKQLLAKKDRPRTGAGSRGGKKHDPNDRSYQAWFAMNQQLMDHDTGDPVFCDNPDCIDPRSKTHGQPVVEVGGRKMCRYCFIEGWLTVHSGQGTLTSG